MPSNKVTLPQGWKSRFYQDRYQLVAVWSEQEQQFIYQHMHLLLDKDFGLTLGMVSECVCVTLRCETPLVAEVYLYVPPGEDIEAIKQQATLDLYEQIDSLVKAIQ